jgi:multidrug efflux pump subunit AcrA (membrane-fusion protein)
MTATVTLSHSADVSVVKLPLAAILNRGTGPSVYVVDTSGALQLRPVQVASFTEDTALVTSGVSNGDRVVKLGVQKLDAGERVRAVDER